MTEEKSNGYYYKVPAELAEGGKPLKALLYALIVSLSSKNGICTASNKFLAKKLGRKDNGTISGYLQDLKKENWIVIIQNQKQGNRRKITLSPHRKNTMTPYEKSEESSLEKTKESIINFKNNLINKEYEDSSRLSNYNKEKIITNLMNHYKEKAKEKHKLEFFNNKTDRKDKKMRNLFNNCFSRFGEKNGREFINWWLDEKGAWAGYLPARAFSTSVYQEFENKEKLSEIEPKKRLIFSSLL